MIGQGVWSQDDVDDHFRDLAELMRNVRSAGRPVRILSDVTSSSRQSVEIEARILQHHERLYESGDRIALLVSPSEKSHVVSLLGKADVATFSSRIAAEMWLMTPDLAKPA
ncbi:MAG: hypothetical protein EON56_04810 [Alphaproteobacteria bacterium]|nr:MAG: hypothetical protein EON56_04810 [Alphaproteobacteria bacterium]